MDQMRQISVDPPVLAFRRQSLEAVRNEEYLDPLREELIARVRAHLLERMRGDDAFITAISEDILPLVRLGVMSRLRLETFDAIQSDDDLWVGIRSDDSFRDRLRALVLRELWESDELVASFSTWVLDSVRREIGESIKEDDEVIARVREEIVASVTRSLENDPVPGQIGVKRAQRARRRWRSGVAVAFLAATAGLGAAMAARAWSPGG